MSSSDQSGSHEGSSSEGSHQEVGSKHKSRKHKRSYHKYNLIDEEAQEKAGSESEEDQDEYNKHKEKKSKYKEMYKPSSYKEEIANRYADHEKYVKDLEERDKQAYQDNYEMEDEDVQSALMPSVKDPRIQLVKVKPNKERLVVVSLMNKYCDKYNSDNPLKITSAQSSDSLKGFVYIEACNEASVREAIKGLNLIYNKPPSLVPINEMPSTLCMDQCKLESIKKNQWCRMNRGIQKGDLAQVVDIAEHRTSITLKVIPRLLTDNLGKKSKNVRPRQRFFNPDELPADKYYWNTIHNERIYTYNNMKFKGKFLHKTVNVKCLNFENIKPTVEEAKLFTSDDINEQDDDNDQQEMLLSLKDNQSKSYEKFNIFQPGERVIAQQGDLAGMEGIVISSTNETVKIKPNNDLESITFNIFEIARCYLPGDTVHVIDGQFKDEYGIVDSIDKKTQQITILSQDKQRVFNVSNKYLKLCKELPSTNIISEYRVNDLCIIKSDKLPSGASAGVVIKLERDSLKMLLNTSELTSVPSVCINYKANKKQWSTVDSIGHSLQKNDLVKVIKGDLKNVTGAIKQIQKNYLWIVNHESLDTSGLSVTTSNNVTLAGAQNAKNHVLPKIYKTRQSESKIGQTVQITTGQFKSQYGVVCGEIGNKFQIELSSKCKKILLKLEDFDTLNVKEKYEKVDEMEEPASYQPQGLKTPALQAQSPSHGLITPSHYSEYPEYKDDEVWNPSSLSTPNRSEKVSYYENYNGENTPNSEIPQAFSPAQ